MSNSNGTNTNLDLILPRVEALMPDATAEQQAYFLRAFAYLYKAGLDPVGAGMIGQLLELARQRLGDDDSARIQFFKASMNRASSKYAGRNGRQPRVTPQQLIDACRPLFPPHNRYQYAKPNLVLTLGFAVMEVDIDRVAAYFGSNHWYSELRDAYHTMVDYARQLTGTMVSRYADMLNQLQSLSVGLVTPYMINQIPRATRNYNEVADELSGGDPQKISKLVQLANEFKTADNQQLVALMGALWDYQNTYNSVWWNKQHPDPDKSREQLLERARLVQELILAFNPSVHRKTVLLQPRAARRGHQQPTLNGNGAGHVNKGEASADEQPDEDGLTDQSSDVTAAATSIVDAEAVVDDPDAVLPDDGAENIPTFSVDGTPLDSDGLPAEGIPDPVILIGQQYS